MSSFLLLAIIPVYKHAQFVEGVIDQLRRYNIPVLLIDDGNNAEDAARLAELAQRKEDVFLERLPVNQGKGAAVMHGLRSAAARGFSHALQVDADGQHDLEAVARFCAAAEKHQEALINGCPQWDASAPKSRRYGRQFCQLWVNINTLSKRIGDAQCGFRVYPLAATLPVIAGMSGSRRMEFDIEIIIRMDWAGVPIINLPVAVHYPADGVSNYRVVKDNLALAKTHSKLFFGMLFRLPALCRRQKEGVAL